MKRTLILLTALCSFSVLAQFDSPAVDWKINDIAPTTPVTATGFPAPAYASDALYQPGVDQFDPSNPYPTWRTGEEWWYSITPYQSSGDIITSGFATWRGYSFDEDNNSLGGCKEFIVTPETTADLERPILVGESLSAKLATVGRYDKNGRMIWCKAYLQGDEGAYSCKIDANGDIVICGWTSSTRSANGLAMTYNPQGASSGDDLDILGLCDDNEKKAFMAKIDASSGDLIWAHIYSMHDLGLAGYTNVEIVELQTKAVDLVVNSNNNYVMVGEQERFNSPGRYDIITLEVDLNGKIIDRSTVAISEHSAIVRSISNYDDEYLISGSAKDLNDIVAGSGEYYFARGHGYLIRLSNSLDPITTFGTTSINCDYNDGTSITNQNIGFLWKQNDYNETNPLLTVQDQYLGRTNIIRDSKKLSNGNITIVSVVDCSGCLSSGANRGIGVLEIYNSNGSSRISNTNGINGEAHFLLNSSNTGMVSAFDMMIGLEPDDPNEITVLTSVDDGESGNATMTTSHPDYSTFSTSMDVISGNTSTNIGAFVSQSNYIPRGGISYPYDVTQTSAYLANYDINGNIRWEKIIDIDDDPMEVYPGDWKEQECVYQVAKDLDGAYWFVGNTSHNKDDYLIARVHGNCNVDLSYDITPIDPVTDNLYEINTGGTVIWNPAAFGNATDINVRGEIRVKSGTTLKITDGLIVHFADGRKMDITTRLIVEKGAKLIVYDATLTSTTCPDAMWNGIEVLGDRDIPQYFSNQGSVIITNAIIENAYEGVRLWEHEEWLSTGGIVRATNSSFINNARSFEFMPYANIINNVEHANLSFIRNCEFITNDNYKLNYIHDHVTMYRVSGIPISGSDFKDIRTSPAESYLKNRGVFSVDSKYKVFGLFTGTGSVLHEYYDPTDYDVCTFTNLSTGIQAINFNSQETITVDHCLFTDCRYGVRLSQVDNVFVTRNKVEASAGGPTFSSTYGIWLDNCTAYQVEGNDIFDNTTLGNGSMGIIISNSGLENNEVFKNKLTELNYGVYSFGKNRNNLPIFDPSIKGLEFSCNEFKLNRNTDEIVSGFYESDGEKLSQGKVAGVPVGNIFSNPSGGLAYHLANYTAANHRYIYNIDEPTLLTGFVKVPTPITADCSTNFSSVFDGSKPVSNSTSITALQTELSNLTPILEDKNRVLDSLLAIGNHEDLFSDVAAVDLSTESAVKFDLLQASPFLSKELLMDLADKSPSNFSEIGLTEVITANIDVALDNEFFDYLSTKGTPLDSHYITQITDSLNNLTRRSELQGEIIGLSSDRERIYNFMIKEIVQDTLGIDTGTFHEYIIDRNHVMAEAQLADNFLGNGMKDSALAHLLRLDTIALNMPISELKMQIEDYSSFKKLMIQETNSLGILTSLSDSLYSVVANYADNSTGLSRAQAQNVLCFFKGECLEGPAIPFGKSLLASDKPNGGSTTWANEKAPSFTIVPNPNNGIFEIVFTEKIGGVVRILDLNGKLLSHVILGDNNATIDVQSYDSGLYFVQWIGANSKTETQKWIKQ